MTRACWFWLVTTCLVVRAVPGADTIRVATYNVENYILAATESRPAKTEASKDKVAAVLQGLSPDLVGLQEVGGKPALMDIQSRLKARGLALPHAEIVHGFDTNIQVALLSRFPITALRPHVDDTYLLSGRRFRVSRGILEADVQVSPGYRLTVFVVHLKSRRAVPEADEGEMRRQEARILREKVVERLKLQPKANVVVLGDFNDTKDSESVRTLVGRGADQWVDTRPSERNGDTGFSPNPRWQPRTVSWTHYYGVEDSYSRIDYVLLHPNAASEWDATASFLPTVPDWGLASDHRPVVVTLRAADR
ncbi:MAG: endonuclease/exonuclease/phosphatase family protein [Verrucomicrobiales bacterium]|nr:endonuclease/exonuclease/phosphatase family protein [Verrucomicrobiales bacterium]